MGATNAKMIDLPAFGLRNIEDESLAAPHRRVNPVLRFHALPERRRSTENARRTSVPRAPSPGRAASLRRRPGSSVRDQADVGKRPRDLTSADGPCMVRGQMMTTALTRVPASPLRLAGACALILLVIIAI